MELDVLGKDPDGKIWFKSDQKLTDITDAFNFYVETMWPRIWFIPGSYCLWAKYKSVTGRTNKKTLGWYPNAREASRALEEIWRLRQIDGFDVT